MNYELLSNGDYILSVTDKFITIVHDDGTADLFPISVSEKGIIINTELKTTISFDSDTPLNEVDIQKTGNGVTIINF